ncbi:MAG: hypothetical protein ABF289_12490 [Clostridiales bacterium]
MYTNSSNKFIQIQNSIESNASTKQFPNETEILYKFLIKKSILIFGSNHPITADYIFCLAKFHLKNNSLHKANPLFIWANDVVESNSNVKFRYEKELKKILKNLYYNQGWLNIN